MKSIFKLYIFKLAILSLTMIFISFGASALTIEKLYKDCKPFQSNGFEFNNLDSNQIQRAIACFSYLSGLKNSGFTNCIIMREFNRIKYVDKKKLDLISSLLTNANVDIDQVITSFTNYAENNTEFWKNELSNYARKFISKKFPCKLD